MKQEKRKRLIVWDVDSDMGLPMARTMKRIRRFVEVSRAIPDEDLRFALATALRYNSHYFQ